MKEPLSQNTNANDLPLSESSGPEQILVRLKSALKADGDFPVRAKIVVELKKKVNDPNTNIPEIADIILREPSLGPRVLHLVNSAFYSRGQQVMTITQAVVQLGMRTISDICAGMILMQKFGPTAKRGGIFSSSLKKSVLTSLISASLAEKTGQIKIAEQGYLAGTFFGLGELLLAYYFPQVIEAGTARSRERGKDVYQSITEILGIEPQTLSVTIMDGLEIPRFYKEVLLEAHKPPIEIQGPNAGLARVLNTAELVSQAILREDSLTEIANLLEQLAPTSGLSVEQLKSMICELPQSFEQQCRIIEMDFLSLPDHMLEISVDSLKPGTAPKRKANPETSGVPKKKVEKFSRYIQEMEQAIESHEPVSSIITTAMETLAFGLEYPRVVLLLADRSRKVLEGKMAIGSNAKVDVKSIKRIVDAAAAARCPDIKAFLDGNPQFSGEPLIDGCDNFIALPIGYKDRSLGVLYADALPNTSEQIPANNIWLTEAMRKLADYLDKAIGANHKH